MENRNEAKITMFKSVEQHLDAAGPVIQSVGALASVVGNYKALIAGISESMPTAMRSVSGVTADKAEAKNKLIAAAADLAALVRAYASDVGNNTLFRDADRRRYMLSQLRDEGLGPICRTILERVNEHRIALSDYGVTDEKVAALETALTSFQSTANASRAALGNRKTTNERLRQLIRQSDDLLVNRLDNLVENFRLTNREFYDMYFTLREVSPRGNRITQIRGAVTNAATGTPIKNATVTIGGKTTTTDSRGEYAIKPIPPGKQTLRIEAEGYIAFENDETQIAPGELKRTTTTLTPAN